MVQASSFLTALVVTVAQAQRGVYPTPEEIGRDNCNMCIEANDPYMYCPDGSCESREFSTCSSSGTIYTAQTGCRALSQCDVGNRGLIVIGESMSLLESQGGVDFSDEVTFEVPTNSPCVLNVMNPHQMSMQFSTDISRGFSWYALEMDSINNSFYSKVNPRNPFITELEVDYMAFYFGSTKSDATTITLSWQTTPGQG